MRVEERAQAAHPIQFEAVLFGSHHLSVGNVHVHYLYACDVGGKQTSMRILVVTGITTLRVFALSFGKNGNAVVSLLAKCQAFVPTLAENIRWKLVVCALRLLHAEHIRLNRVEPARDQRQQCKDRVDVPGSDLHSFKGLATKTQRHKERQTRSKRRQAGTIWTCDDADLTPASVCFVCSLRPVSRILLCLSLCLCVSVAMPYQSVAINPASSAPRRGMSSIRMCSCAACAPSPSRPRPSRTGAPIAAAKFPSEAPPTWASPSS